MERPGRDPPQLDRVRSHLGELRGLVTAFDKAVPQDFRLNTAEPQAPVAAFDAGIPALEAPMESLEADLLAVNAMAADLPV